MSALGKLKKASSDKPKKSKSSVVDVSNPEMEEVCNQLIEASRDYKNAEAALKLAQAEVIDYVKPLHRDGLKKNDPVKSFRLNEKVLCLFTDKFKVVGEEDSKEIKEAIGEEAMGRLFQEKLSLSIKKEIAADDEKIGQLLEILGEENLHKFFDFSVVSVARKDFFKNVARESVVNELEDVIDRIHYKPTVRVG